MFLVFLIDFVCQNSDCLNGGTCLENGNCECQFGYSGYKCSTCMLACKTHINQKLVFLV